MDTDSSTINPEDFLGILREKGEVRDAKVSGRVQLRSLSQTGEPLQDGAPETGQETPFSIPHALYRVVNVTFADRFVCDGARLEAELVFERCRFDQGFSARGARMQSGLDLLRCTFTEPKQDYAVHLDGAQIKGDLRFLDNRVVGWVGARRMHVTGDASFSGLKISQRARPLNDVATLYQAPFGELDQDFERIRQELGAKGASLLNLCDSRVDGSLYLGGLPYPESAAFDDPFAFEEDCPEPPMLSVISGHLLAKDLKVGRDLVLWNMRVIGDINLRSAAVGGAVKGQMLVRRKTRTIPCQLEVAGDFLIPEAVIGTDLELDGALIRGNVECSRSTMASLLGNAVCIELDWYVQMQIGGSLQLSGSNIDSITLQAAHIRCGLAMLTGQLQRVYIAPQVQTIRVRPGDDPVQGVAVSGSESAGTYRLRLQPCQLGSIELQSVLVTDDLILAGVDLRDSSRTAPETPLQGAGRQICVTNCKVGGSLRLGMTGIMQINAERGYWIDDPEQRYRRLLGGPHGMKRKDVQHRDTLLPDPGSAMVDLGQCRKDWFSMDATCPAEVPGRVELSHNKVEGELDISHLNVTGDICLDGVKIGLDLRAPRFETGLGGVKGSMPIFSTRCASLSMQNLRCEGDGDLTGVVLQAGAPVDPVRGVRGPYASVKGDLLLWSMYPEPGQGRGGSNGRPGSNHRSENMVLDLQGAKIGRLRVSGTNFPPLDVARVAGHEPGAVQVRSQARLSLENATIGRFEIKELSRAAARHAKFNLSGINVVKWDLPDETYLDVLSSEGEFFSGDVYAQVEKSLRSEGKDALANSVHIQMRKELEARMWAEKKFLRAMASTTHRALTNYGTSAWTPFVCILAIMVVNTALFLESNNVVASVGYVRTMAEADRQMAYKSAGTRLHLPDNDPRLDITPTDRGRLWGVEDALTMALRFSVPLVNVAVNDTWEPADRRPAVPCPASLLSGVKPQCELLLRVSTITRLLGYFSWIFWPLFIFRVSAFINRRDR